MAADLLVRVSRPLLGLAVFALALAAWQAWALSRPSFAVPPASTVLATAWDVWPTGDFLVGVGASLQRLVVGFAIAACVGVAMGLLMGASRATRQTLEPLVELGRATPVIAIVPAAMLVLGFGNAMRIGVIAVAVCFPVMVNTLDGVRSIAPETHDVASTLHVGRVERVLRIDLPSALPSIAAGLRIGISLGLIAVVISEFVGGVGGESDGLGTYIWFHYGQTNIEELYAGLLFLGLLGFALNRLFLVIECRLLSWHEGFAGE